jgi:hypothetical protein
LVFILKRKLFQESFENAFEILEKRKGNKNLTLLGFWPEVFPPLFLAQPVFFLFGPKPATGRVTGRPSQQLPHQAVAPPSLSLTDMPGPRYSAFISYLVLGLDSNRESDAATLSFPCLGLYA